MKVNLTDRIKSAFIDYLAGCGIAGILMPLFFFLFKLYGHPLYLVLIISIVFSFLICKDLINGKSVGKRVVKLKVVKDNNKEASLWQLYVRNIFLFIWPVDSMFWLFKPDQKLGDLVAQTKVVHEEEVCPPSIPRYGVKISIIFILTSIGLFFLFYGIINHSPFQYLYMY